MYSLYIYYTSTRISIPLALQSVVSELHALLKQVYRMTPKCLWKLWDQRYPIFPMCSTSTSESQISIRFTLQPGTFELRVHHYRTSSSNNPKWHWTLLGSTATHKSHISIRVALRPAILQWKAISDKFTEWPPNNTTGPRYYPWVKGTTPIRSTINHFIFLLATTLNSNLLKHKLEIQNSKTFGLQSQGRHQVCRWKRVRSAKETAFWKSYFRKISQVYPKRSWTLQGQITPYTFY